ncbi:MAG: DsbA family oxidoreductase [Clostridia bacterium]|nr:DsbA family oxidoreductase [Clostridia bacterium]
MKIVYWSDYACPFCYIGETYLKKAIARLGVEDEDEVEIEMKAFELNPEAAKEYVGDTVSRFAVKYGLSKKAAADRIESISRIGRDAGLDFRYAETRYTSTYDAHRLTKLAQKQGGNELANVLSEKLYKAYFSEGLELADHDVLVKIALESGLDKLQINEVLSSDEFGDKVKNDEWDAHANSVRVMSQYS